MNETKVLFVDDEPSLVVAYRRLLGRCPFQVHTATSAKEALKKIAECTAYNPYAVIISDMRMPAMDGIQLFAKVRQLSSTSVCILLTGDAEQKVVRKAITENQISRVLDKPCSMDLLKRTITTAIQEYRQIAGFDSTSHSK